MAQLSYINGFAVTTSGAIVGANPSPFNAIQLLASSPNSDYLTSGALSSGSPGEFGGLTGMTVDFWFQADGLPGSDLPIIRGPDDTGDRQWKFHFNTAGTIALGVRLSGTTYFATSATVLSLNTWYHVGGAWDGAANTVRIYVNGVQDGTTAGPGALTAIAASSFASGDTGSMLVGNSSATMKLQFDELALYRIFIGASRMSAHYTAGTAMGLNVQKPGARMISILDRSISHAAPRSLQAGSRNVMECYFAGQSPLDELNRADAAENLDAMLFVARDGTITFLDANHRSSAPWNASQVTFGDGGGSEIPYLDFSIDYSEQFLVNEFNVTRSSGRITSSNTGETQTFSDATSISSYFKHSQSELDVPVIDDADIATIGAALLTKYKNPMLRASDLKLSCGTPAVTEAIFKREIGDHVTVKRRPPGGGSAISQDFYIQKISIQGTPDQPWTASFGLSPL